MSASRAEKRRQERRRQKIRHVRHTERIRARHGRQMFVFDRDLDRVTNEINWEADDLNEDDILRTIWPNLDPDSTSWTCQIAAAFLDPEATTEWVRGVLVSAPDLLSPRAVVEVYCEHIRGQAIRSHPLIDREARSSLQLQIASLGAEGESLWLALAMCAVPRKDQT